MAEPQAEVLERAPARTRELSRRAVAVVLAVLLVVGGTAYAVDRRIRHAEGRALAECAAGAEAAVDRAYAPVVSMWTYVRPALDNGASLMVRFGMYRLLSQAAEGESAVVAQARDDCAAVSVLAVHRGLRDRRDRCVRLLEEHVDFLERAARSGVTLNGPWPHRVDDC